MQNNLACTFPRSASSATALRFALLALCFVGPCEISAAAASRGPGVLVTAVDDSPHPLMYAQELVDRTMEEHPELLDVILHVTPPHSSQNMAIAAHTKKERNQKSGSDDVAVMTTGEPVVEVQKDGARIGILLPLDDRSGQRIGSVGLMFAWHKGDNEPDFLERATVVRNSLQSKISSKPQLFQPE